MKPDASAERLDHAQCYRALCARDRRFDGMFVTAVHTTGIYCRPSCPARTPKPANVSFFKTAAAAHRSGFRACRRCRPDAVPGSPEWDARADLVGRAMCLIRDGVVDREGTAGLASRLGYSARQVRRALVAELGAGPTAIARAYRAHTARVLIDTTTMPFTQVAFAAGFPSIRQFNDTIREVYATTPSRLRAARRPHATPGALTLVLAVREPFAADELRDFLARRAIPGVEEMDGTVYRRTVWTPAGAARVALDLAGAPVVMRVEGDPACVPHLVCGARRLLDLDADPQAADETLGAIPGLASSVADCAGIRVPGQFDGFEIAVRAVLGQQVSVAGARTTAQRLCQDAGEHAEVGDNGPEWFFPRPEALADMDPARIGVPASRARALTALARKVAVGELELSPGADRAHTRRALEEIPGIGPWTYGYIAMRALRDPDAMPHNDLVVRRVAQRIGIDPALSPARPWRAHATMHLWRMANHHKETA